VTDTATAEKPPAVKPKPEPKKPAVWESLAAALVAAQGEMKAVVKDQENPHYKSKFMSLDNLIEQTRPVLHKHGLAVVQFPCVSELGAPMLRTQLIHGGSGERLEADMPLFLSSQNMQQLGSAITYARRYAWAAVLGVAAEEDDDANTTAAKTDRKPAPTVISDAQRKRLFAIAHTNKVDEARLKEILLEVVGSDSTKDIKTDSYDRVVELVENEGVPF